MTYGLNRISHFVGGAYVYSGNLYAVHFPTCDVIVNALCLYRDSPLVNLAGHYPGSGGIVNLK
eukprot:scaffold272640_cov49-Attheya_sp.AAC.1